MNNIHLRVTGCALLVLLLSTPAQSALVYDWFITDPLQTVGATDVVSVHGRFVNDVTSDVALDLDAAVGTAVASSLPSGAYTSKFGPAVGNFQSQFNGVTINPGQVFDFVFATLTPSPGPVPAADYYITGAGIVVNGITDYWQVIANFPPPPHLIGGTVKITVDGSTPPPGAVPLPAAVWLFGTALLGLLGFRRKHR